MQNNQKNFFPEQGTHCFLFCRLSAQQRGFSVLAAAPRAALKVSHLRLRGGSQQIVRDFTVFPLHIRIVNKGWHRGTLLLPLNFNPDMTHFKVYPECYHLGCCSGGRRKEGSCTLARHNTAALADPDVYLLCTVEHNKLPQMMSHTFKV